MRNFQTERRARTRRLIELGGLVVKARVAELTCDDRATILGALLEIADRLRRANPRDAQPADLMALWRRQGLNAFDADAAAKTAQREQGRAPAAPENRTKDAGKKHGPDPRGLEPSRSRDP